LLHSIEQPINNLLNPSNQANLKSQNSRPGFDGWIASAARSVALAISSAPAGPLHRCATLPHFMREWQPPSPSGHRDEHARGLLCEEGQTIFA
jgi:hypothetical protein